MNDFIKKPSTAKELTAMRLCSQCRYFPVRSDCFPCDPCVYDNNKPNWQPISQQRESDRHAIGSKKPIEGATTSGPLCPEHDIILNQHKEMVRLMKQNDKLNGVLEKLVLLISHNAFRIHKWEVHKFKGLPIKTVRGDVWDWFRDENFIYKCKICGKVKP